jgi:aldehyde dehydrogenase (NAD+)
MHEWTDLYVDGGWRTPSLRDSITVYEAATGEAMGRVPMAGAADVEQAMGAARRAFPSWSETPVSDRCAAIYALADGLAAREAELAELMAREVGTPLAISVRVQVGLAVSVLRSMADLALEVPAEERIGTSLVVRQPVGVVVAITPWNYPLYQLAAKVGPALAAGCTTVVKPSTVAPLATFVLAQIAHDAGLPPGVFNLLSGRGAVVGELLARHPETDMVSITGSTAAGARVAGIAAAGITRVALELGGKSAFLLVEGADLEAATAAAVRGCFVNNGQTCAATTRLLVPSALLGEVEERVRAQVSAFTVGDPLDAETDVGPLASAVQQETVEGYLKAGAAEGTTLVGGPGVVPGRDRGYFVNPSVFSRLAPDATVVREEIFGPVLAIVAYDGIEEGIRLANDSDYGLSGAVWAESVPAAVEVARRLRTGQVAVNGGRFNARAPFGGFKKSGVGRELGEHGLAEYVELTSIQFPSAQDLASFEPAP